MGAERRRFRRITYREAVQYRVFSGHESQERTESHGGGCLSSDLSEGGLRFTINDFVPVRAELVLNIMLEDLQRVDAKARVVWIQKNPHGENYQIGTEFDDAELNAQLARKIQEFTGSR